MREAMMEGLPIRIRQLFDRDSGLENHLVARWIFLRALGGIYFSAFLALLFQIRGLIGAGGILPAHAFLVALGQYGWLRYWYAPSLMWLSSSDAALMAICWTGLAASVLVVVNVLPQPALITCFVCFLSFVGISQDFGQYQSDGMLLEAGFLALFAAPAGLLPGWGRRSLPVRGAVFLLLWEWFRIYFESGMVKLLSGDPTWRNLTAMDEYYQNGPLPTWVGWYVQHLPEWFHRATAGATLGMELVLVWMALIPRRRWRIACFWIVTLWQAGVILTANYAFLNYLVLVLGFLLLDDTYLRRAVPRRWLGDLGEGLDDVIDRSADRDADDEHRQVRGRTSRFSGVLSFFTGFFLLWVGYATFTELVLMVWPGVPLLTLPAEILEPFRVANSYGLFARMTPHRYEIEFQGSIDGSTWTAYPFRFKPQDVKEKPGIYAPYQPRFDWNLWFASLGPEQESPIVLRTEERLLEGDSSVLALFRSNPFAERPPRYVRAVLWQYWFSTWEQKRMTGVWWRRQLLGAFTPALAKLPDGSVVETAPADLDGPPPD